MASLTASYFFFLSSAEMVTCWGERTGHGCSDLTGSLVLTCRWGMEMMIDQQVLCSYNFHEGNLLLIFWVIDLKDLERSCSAYFCGTVIRSELLGD